MKRILTTVSALAIGAGAAMADSSQAPSGLVFAGAAREAVPFTPFTIEARDGTPVPPDQDAVLKLDDAELRSRVDEHQAQAEGLRGDGYAVSGSPLEDLGKAHRTTAGAYARQLGGVERTLNGLGYTLRDEGGIKAHEAQVYDRAALGDQVTSAKEIYVRPEDAGLRPPASDEAVAARHASPQSQERQEKQAVYLESQKDKCKDPLAGESRDDFEKRCFLANGVDEPTRRANVNLDALGKDDCRADSPLGRAMLVNETWSDAGGDKNFGWAGQASFKFKTDALGLTTSADGEAEGMIMGKSKKLIEGQASFTSPRSGKSTGKVGLSVAGRKIFPDQERTWDQSLVSSRDSRGDELFLYDEDVNIVTANFLVGFVPVSVSVSAKMTAGFSYQLDLLPVKVMGRAELIERIGLLAAAGVGTDLELFEILIGAKGYVDLIDAALGTYPEAELVLTPQNRPAVTAHMDARMGMRTLSGTLNLGVWAKTKFPVPQPKSGWPFLEMKPMKYEWKQTLADYPGYEFPSAVIFDHRVGYDVCSGQKTVETTVANQPRPRDARMDYAMREMQRVKDMEIQAGQAMDGRLDDPRVKEAVEGVAQSTRAMAELRDALTAFSHETLVQP